MKTFKPNTLGWVFIVSASFTSFYFVKSIIKQIFELFDYYDYNMMYLNFPILFICLYMSYIFLRNNIHKFYE